MPSPSIYLRTPDATPGSIVKILWDFTCSTMGATQPPQYELFKSRITSSTSRYWAAVHIPLQTKNQPRSPSWGNLCQPHRWLWKLRHTKRLLAFDSWYLMPANEGII